MVMSFMHAAFMSAFDIVLSFSAFACNPSSSDAFAPSSSSRHPQVLER
jgi:hypothetical protein